MSELSPTQEVAAKVLFAAFEVLRDNGGEMRGRDVVRWIEEHIELSDWAKERYESSGQVRWQTFLHFFTGDCVKAGYMVKKSGTWYLTEEGEQAMALGPEKLLQSAMSAYRAWRAETKGAQELAEEEGLQEAQEEALTMDQVQELANAGLERHIEAMNAYEFQDLAAALLRGMGYFTPFVSPKGKDGGVDVIAYRDPLGTMSPRIKVQVKHTREAIGPQDIRQLMGLLQKDGDVGIFISSGGFTRDAKTSARGGQVHVELIDMSRFIELWQEHYPRMDDEDKALMPLVPVYFLAEAE